MVLSNVLASMQAALLGVLLLLESGACGVRVA
jgi:hypothetical protein